jgi:hypothetical protein
MVVRDTVNEALAAASREREGGGGAGGHTHRGEPSGESSVLGISAWRGAASQDAWWERGVADAQVSRRCLAACQQVRGFVTYH